MAADPIGTLLTQLTGITGITAYMPVCYRDRAPSRVAPPYGEILDEFSEPLINTACFEGSQVERYGCTLAFWALDKDDCKAWADLVKASLSDWGTVTVSGYGTIPGVERGRVKFTEEPARDGSGGLVHKVTMEVEFQLEYTAALG